MTPDDGQHALQRIACWSSTLSYAAIPDDVRSVARRCLIDTLGVTIAGVRTDVADRSRKFACMVGAPGDAGVVGAQTRLAAPMAAFANAVAAHALDFDDNSYAGVVHGSAVIIPAALAIAETVNASGADLVTAIVAGSEAEYALGVAVTPTLYDRGWWTTGVLGPVGAAAATARLLKLDASATASALGLALAGTGGVKAAFGTNAKPLLAGRAAEAGVVAALLAAAGASGPGDAVEHPRGFAALFNGGIFEAQAIAALGTRWHLLDPGIDVKRIPVCLSSHAAVDAVQDLVAQHGLAVCDIRRITCDVPSVVAANLAYDCPQTPQEAQFSMSFAVAAALRFGDIRLEHLTDAVVADKATVTLMDKVIMHTGPRWSDPAARAAAPEGAHVRIDLNSGQTLDGYRARPRGSAGEPLSDAEIDTKFRHCATVLLEAASADTLLRNLQSVEVLPSTRDLLDVLHREPV